MKKLTGNITKVKGITALGKHIGIKPKKQDFAVIYSEKIANAAAVYTKNKVKGAPLYVTKSHLKNGKAQAIVINSGIANVCTGKKGIDDAKLTTKLVAKELNIKQNDVLVASTGLIGDYLPMDVIKGGVKDIKKQLSKKSKVAKAILTTDIVEKQIAVKVDNITIGAIAKGSGMVHPDMATMLGFICTDADIQSKKLHKMLVNSVNKSFNMVSVDSDTSTSDMVILMANGLAGKVNETKFQKALDYVCIELAKKIAADGEGATTLIECKVNNAKNEQDAKKIAKSVISSPLVKCNFFGKDVNWGRIMCATGYSGVDINPDKVDVFINKIKIVSKGHGLKNKKKIKKTLNKKSVLITINIYKGKAQATAYGCDLTTDYVKFNGHYTT